MSKAAIEKYFKERGLLELYNEQLASKPEELEKLAMKVSTGQSISSDLRPILDRISAFIPLTNEILIKQFKLDKRKFTDEVIQTLCDAYREGIIGNRAMQSQKVSVGINENLTNVIDRIKNSSNKAYQSVQMLFYSGNKQNPKDLVAILFINIRYLPIDIRQKFNIDTSKSPIPFTVLRDTVLGAGLNKLNSILKQLGKRKLISAELGHTLTEFSKDDNYLGVSPLEASQRILYYALTSKDNLTEARQAQVNALKNKIKDSLYNLERLENYKASRKKGYSRIVNRRLITKLSIDVVSKSNIQGILKELKVYPEIYLQELSEDNQLTSRLIETPSANSIFTKKLVNMLGKDIISIETSPPVLDTIEEAFKHSIRGKKVKSHSTKSTTTIKSEKKVAVPKSKNVEPKKAQPIKVETILPSGTIASVGDTSSSNTSLSNILVFLQTNIRESVKDNMDSPRLVYRTGRFADSVKIRNVTRSAKGLHTITYQYATFPYQTFEPGYEQASNARDPRGLIRKAIRDIVAEKIGNNFKAVRIGGTGSRGRIT